MSNLNSTGKLEEQITERNRMVRILSDVRAGHLSPSETPSDAYTYYGSVETLNRAIRAGQAERLIGELGSYAKFGEDSNHQSSAETVIARRFAQQLRSGYADVDLTQQYATDDPQIATARHDLAVTRLSEFISRAEELGYRVHRGEAIAATLKQVHVFAIAGGFGD